MFDRKIASLILLKIGFVLVMLICLTSYINSPIALILGFLFTHFLGHPFHKYNSKAVNWLLKIAVIGLGFGMNIGDAIAVSSDGLTLTIISIVVVLGLGYFVGNRLKIENETTHLISSGTAICGGSAIAAIAPVIGAKEKNISIALGVVFLLNSIALLLFPLVGEILDMSQYDFGLWCAIAIHDTSSVVGAAGTYGDLSLDVATMVKMARVVWIIPLSIVSMLLFKGKQKSINIPWFILVFILVIVLNTYFLKDSKITFDITFLAKKLFILTLFLVGAGISIEKIKSSGLKPIILGITLWASISLLSLCFILY